MTEGDDASGPLERRPPDDPGQPGGSGEPTAAAAPFRFVLHLLPDLDRPASSDRRAHPLPAPAGSPGPTTLPPSRTVPETGAEKGEAPRNEAATEQRDERDEDRPDGPDWDDAGPAGEQVLEPRIAARHRPRRRAAQRVVLGLNVIAIVGCLLAAGTLWWTYDRVREMPVVALGAQLAPVADDASGGGVGGGDDAPRNFLIVGTDSASEDSGTDVRADTIMVLRIDPASERAALLSLPRDLYLPIAGQGGSARINSAIQGGPARLIEIISASLGVPVNHYVEIDFAGFEDLVDAVGGVPVFFPEPVRDQQSFLSVPVAGCTILDPPQALAFVRSRSYEVRRDGGWEVDGSGDLGRISRQQDFIRRVLDRAIQRGARNPATLRELVEIGFDRLTVDDGLALGDVLALGDRFRSFEAGNLDLYALPVYDELVQGAQVLRLDRVAAQPTLDLFRGDDGAAGTIVVQVLNGNGEPGVAESAAAALAGAGFVVPAGNTGDADRFDYANTTVRFPEGAEADAVRVASHLGADPVVERVPSIAGGRVAVVIGADWPGVVIEPRTVAPDLVPTTTTTTATTTTIPPTSATPATPADGEDPAAPSSLTTTAQRGEVPGAPAGVTC